ncbi:hypothetical protein BUE80_DR007604 [Diplocarpon rosae]|nr:hypothetical protein BUE80_DR007604 [Diplocarpon rosae]
MRRPKSRKPPSLHLHISSEETPSRCSSVLSDCDADDEGLMSSGELLPSRPLSLAIPTRPYYPRRPTLQEVLSNTAPPPWTLAAFMQYLSQNHCLETLEFTMDAKRYEKHYRDMVDGDSHTPISPQSTEFRIIYELMEESVLVPFLNSVAPSRSADAFSSPWTSDESVTDGHMSGSSHEQPLSPVKSRTHRDGSPPGGSDLLSQPYRGASPWHSHHPHLAAAFAGRSGVSHLCTYLAGSSGNFSTEAPDTMTDDGTDSPSPSVSALEPMTPPNTPPTSNVAFDASPGTSPHTAREGSSNWKKMGAKLGWKKTRIPIPVIAPLDYPVASLVHGTTWRLSEGIDSESPVLEAHPGSPVDLTGSCPASTAAVSVQCTFHGSEEGLSDIEKSTRAMGLHGESIMEDVVAAKESTNRMSELEKLEQDVQMIPKRRAVRQQQPFYAPAKAPEQDEAARPMSPEDSKTIIATFFDQTQMNFEFDEDTGRGHVISATPTARASRTCLATTPTPADPFVGDRFSHGALTVDTSVASSAASMFSSAASTQSATTMTSSDIYGWEEELDRKNNANSHSANEREAARRLPSGGRTMGPRHRGGVHDYQYKHGAGKGKSLLCRVLNLSGSRGERRNSADDAAEGGTMVCPSNEYPTSAI